MIRRNACKYNAQSQDNINVIRSIKFQASSKFLHIFKAPLHTINISVYNVQPFAEWLIKMLSFLPLNYKHQLGVEATKEETEWKTGLRSLR